MGMVKRILFKTAAVLLSLLLFLVGLELVVRLFNLAQPRTGQQHPIYGTSYIPGQGAVNEYGVFIEIGDHGFRGPTPDLEKPPGLYRVVILGDSFLQAVAMPFEKTFYSILDNRFKKRGLPIEVINMGVEGYGTAQEYLVYHHAARPYRPDLVILFFYAANDLYENRPGLKHRPTFELTDGRLREIPFQVKRRGLVRDFLRRNVLVYNYLPDLLRSRIALVEEKVKRVDRRRERERRQQRFEERADIDYTPSLLKKSETDGEWRISLALLDRLHDEVAADGAILAVCAIPNVSQVYDRYWRMLVDEFPSRDGEEYERFRPQRILKDQAGRSGFDYLPLAEHLYDRAVAGGPVVFILGDLHFNEEGNHLLADFLEPYIEAGYRGRAEPVGADR